MGTTIIPASDYEYLGIEVIDEPLEIVEEVDLAEGSGVIKVIDRTAAKKPQIHIVEEGLEEVQFGEFLVEKHAITRSELFRALCEQDRYPGVRLGEVVAALGMVPYQHVDRLLSEYHSLQVVEVGN